MALKPSIVILIIFTVFNSAAVSAQPTVTNEATLLEGGKYILISFESDLASMENCHFSVQANAHKQPLDELPGKHSISIASFYRPVSFVQIIAGPIRKLKRASSGPLSKSHVRIYIRTEIPCSDKEWGKGETISLRIPTYKSGHYTRVKGLLGAMKYHMKVYGE